MERVPAGLREVREGPDPASRSAAGYRVLGRSVSVVDLRTRDDDLAGSLLVALPQEEDEVIVVFFAKGLHDLPFRDTEQGAEERLRFQGHLPGRMLEEPVDEVAVEELVRGERQAEEGRFLEFLGPAPDDLNIRIAHSGSFTGALPA